MACQGEGQVVLDVDGIMGGVYRKGATRNYTDWSNPQVDAWFEDQKDETDPEARREINKELESFLFTQQDNHWITLGWGVLQWMIGEDIRGFNAPERSRLTSSTKISGSTVNGHLRSKQAG